jgi:homospermidine synthase
MKKQLNNSLSAKYKHDYNTRKKLRESLFNSVTFNNKITIFGFGAVGRVLLYMILKVIKIDKRNITVYDKRKIELDSKENLWYSGVTFTQIEILQENFKNCLKHMTPDSILIDCTYGLSSIELINYCSKKQINYINSCLEDWHFRSGSDDYDPVKDSLYYMQKRIESMIPKFGNKFTAILTMGVNPGNVSIWAKLGLDEINKKYQIKNTGHADLAQKLNVQVIHISEHDSQKTNVPKKDHQYCNTWSSDGEAYYEESLGCIEGSWGTHEKEIPKETIYLKDNYFVMDKMSLYTYAQSYVPINGRYIGNIIAHEESHGIGHCLTIFNPDKTIKYKPSVYYVYHPCNEARMSLEELKDRDLDFQEDWRLLSDDIFTGKDELGLTYFLGNKEKYWIGSLLDITEARDVFNNEYNTRVNATIVQVMAGYLSGLLFIIECSQKTGHKGVLFPDELYYEQILNWSLPFLGEFYFSEVTQDFKVVKIDLTHKLNNKETTEWNFNNFLLYK